MTRRKIEYWVIPPEQDAEFVACMEEVLENKPTIRSIPDGPIGQKPYGLLRTAAGRRSSIW